MAALFNRAKQSESIEEFWKNVEAEIGEPILAYSLGRYLNGREEKGPLWGIVYHSASTFYFRHFPQQNWFSSLVMAGSDLGGSSSKNKEVLIAIPLGHIRAVETSSEQTLMQRIFNPQPPIVSLIGTFEATPPFRFLVENNRERFIASLRAVVPS